MIAFLKSWVLNIVTLVVFILLLEIMIPSGKVRKFVNLLTGLILIMALISPVLDFLGRGLDLKEFQIADTRFLDRKEIERKSSLLKEEQMKQTTELYRKKLIRQIEESIGKIDGVESIEADVIINEDYRSDSFGEIKRIYLYVKRGEKTDGIAPVTEIEKIRISTRRPQDTGSKSQELYSEGMEAEEIDNEIRQHLEDTVSRLFGIDKENVVVNSDKSQRG